METPPRSFDLAVRGISGLVGVGLLAAGTVATFGTENGPGAAALVAAGAALLFVAYAGERITRIRAGTFEAELAEPARLLEAATLADAAGDPALASELRAEAVEQLERLAATGQAYAAARATRPASAARTRELERLLADARAAARNLDVPPERVRRWFEGNEGERINAVAAMYEHDRYRDPDLLVEGIEHSASAFEQYHVLRIALLAAPTLPAEERQRLRRAVEAQRAPTGWIKPGTDRRALSEQLLEKL